VLEAQGANVPVTIFVPATGKTATTTAQIDTGSTISGVDQALLQSLGAPAIGSLPIGTPGGSFEANLYQAKIVYQGLDLTAGLPGGVLGEQLPAPVQSLVGRDVLANYDLVYEGQQGAFALSANGAAPGSTTLSWLLGIGLVLLGAGAAIAAEKVEQEHRALVRRRPFNIEGRRAA
jgi:hypothetical protein